MTLITSSYEHQLGAAYHRIDNRGLQLDEAKLQIVRDQIEIEIKTHLNFLINLWGFPIYIGRENALDDARALNLNSPDKKLARLKELGYKVPKVRKKDEETHEYEMEDSVGELALQKLLADPSLWPSPESGQGIKHLLEITELITFRKRYVNARLYKGQYFTNYNVAATVTGRRGSKKSIFGLGGNAQNFPARGRLSDLWYECIVARWGRIFFFVDQMQAEDWPVQALSENYNALTEMLSGINRHYKFASTIFGRTIDDLKRGRKSGDSACEMEYYLGKKGRHANNYGMQAQRLSEALAGEGYSIPKQTCILILDTINKVDPNVRGIFHQYIQKCLYDTRKLCTPLGRERQFFGLRQNDKNYALLNEAYAYIPQSTVGDNTGLAVLSLDGVNDYVVQEGHDSICQEVPDKESELLLCFKDTKRAFDRTIQFHNGISISIPIEAKMGYNWHNKVEISEFSEEGVLAAYKKLKEQYAKN